MSARYYFCLSFCCALFSNIDGIIRCLGLVISPSILQFKDTFAKFTQNQLANIDWKNCIVAGGAIFSSLRLLPPSADITKCDGDIDIFIYGLSTAAASAKGINL